MVPVRALRRTTFLFLMLAAGHAAALESRAWLDAKGLERVATAKGGGFEAIVARVKGAKDPVAAQERILLFRDGKLAWQSDDKELAEPAFRFHLYSVGRDLDGSGQPALHFTGYSGGAHCCTTHYVFRLRPAVKRHAVYESRNTGGSNFVDVPGRRVPVMISADDSSAYAFGPYAVSYFPMVLLQVTAQGSFRLARDLMRAPVVGGPPPLCAQAGALANPWFKTRCAEFGGGRQRELEARIRASLGQVEARRGPGVPTWEDFESTGVLTDLAEHMNRLAYTGHEAAGVSWLESVWPGGNPVKSTFLERLRETRAKSDFADDLRLLDADAVR